MDNDFVIIKKLAHNIQNQVLLLNIQIENEFPEIVDTTEMAATRNLISKAVRKIYKTSKLLSDFSKIHNQSFQPCDIVTLIDSILIQYTTHNRFNNIIWQPRLDNLEISADENLLSSAISNLLDNALRYSHKNSPVRISLEVEKQSVSIMISNLTSDKSLRQKLKFNPDNISFKGTGLMITKRIIECHNGKLSFSTSHNRVMAKILLNRKLLP